MYSPPPFYRDIFKELCLVERLVTFWDSIPQQRESLHWGGTIREAGAQPHTPTTAHIFLSGFK